MQRTSIPRYRVPAKAQFESILQLIGVISGVMNLVMMFFSMMGQILGFFNLEFAKP